MYKLLLRFFIVVFLLIIKIARARPGSKDNNVNNIRVLITGKFYSENWLRAHLLPLSKARNIESIFLVTDYQFADLEKITIIKIPFFLKSIFGASLARLIVFAYYGFKLKPDIVGGYHLLLNGMVALFVGLVCGAKTLYNCGGGVREISGGGYATENQIFGRLNEPDYFIEKYLIKIIKFFDYIIVRGENTKKWMKDRGCATNISIITGGIDDEIFFPDLNPVNDIDIIFSARISEVKRLDIFIEMINIVSNIFPELSAVVVGDGPLLYEIKLLAAKQSVDQRIQFVGHQDNVAKFLRRSKIFVLTSDSEGVSLAMIEAMLCKLPVVVSDVGDLGDFVENNVNGFLIKSRAANEFAAAVESLLKNETKRKSFGDAAYNSACKAKMGNIALKWEGLFGAC